jgi:hypothetical protein
MKKLENRALFYIVILGISLSTTFSVIFMVSQTDSPLGIFLGVGTALFLQLCMYIFCSLGFKLKKDYPAFSGLVIGLAGILLLISIVASSGYFFQEQGKTNLKSYQSSEQYKLNKTIYNTSDSLLQSEIDKKQSLQNRLDKLLKNRDSNEQTIIEKNAVKLISEKKDLHAKYQKQLDALPKNQKTNRKNLLAEMQNKLSDLDSKNDERAGSEISKLDDDINTLKADIEKVDKNINEYSDKTDKKADNINNKDNTDTIETGYMPFFKSLLGNKTGKQVGAYIYLFISIVFEIVSMVLSFILFTARKYSPFEDFEFLQRIKYTEVKNMKIETAYDEPHYKYEENYYEAPKVNLEKPVNNPKTVDEIPKTNSKTCINSAFNNDDLKTYLNEMYAYSNDDRADGYQKIAKRTGLSERTCRRIFEHLKQIGVLKTENKVTKIVDFNYNF